MLKTIYNKISSIINNMLEKVGYFLVGYKVDIELLMTTTRFCKSWAIKNADNIRVLRDTQSHNIDDIKAIQLTIKSMREDYDSLKNNHNELAMDFNKYTELDTHYEDSAKKSLLNTPFKDELTKPSKNVDDNILMLVNIINAITEVKVNNACLLNQYGADITLDKEPYQKYTMQEILEHYIKNDNDDKIATLERINKQYERLLTSDNNYILEEIAKILLPYDNDGININIDDVIDDINDRFNEFNNIYNDACDINSNQRKVK